MVVNVVGLTPAMVGTHTPHLRRLAQRGGLRRLAIDVPLVTCPVQATLLTGTSPARHGIVGNGWYFRDLSEIWFWRQSNALVAGEMVWDAAKKRDPDFTSANMFWWYNMYSSADIGVTPRPIYLADGRKIPDCYTAPAALHAELTARFGRFPLFTFWGPATSIASSRWIARSAIHVRQTRRPTLTLVYLPHLDYVLQRVGLDHPSVAKDLAAVDEVCGELIADAERDGARILIVSEYGINPVTGPIHLNRILRREGYVAVRDELGRDQLDPGASDAVAVADHQMAHIYVRDPSRVAEVQALIAAVPGVARVLDASTKATLGLDHPRSGELVALADADRWFTYYHWLDDERAPDFARTVDIHRKPGYDPVELFIDPAFRFPKLATGWRLAKRKLGLRGLIDVIPLDAGLVRGSHGVPTGRADDGPLLISSAPACLPDGDVAATDFKRIVLDHVFAERRDARDARQDHAA